MKRLPPWFVRLRIAPSRGFLPTLLLPVFLLWPLLFALLAPLFLFGLLVLLVIDARSLPRWCSLCSGVYRLVCETRGIHVDVRGPHAHVLVSVI
jgi:hypothetical protein